MKKIFSAILAAMIMVWLVGILGALLFEKQSDNVDASEITETIGAERHISVLVDEETQILSLNSYLVGVLVSEMPVDFHIEAKKAQAVAARTFALRMEKYSTKHGACAVCDDPGCCQGYLSDEAYISCGGTEEGLVLARKAVEQTDGMVITYEGVLIEATYFSCSGGRTEDAIAVWGTEIPYLQSIDSPGEESAFYYVKSTRFTIKEFQNGLGVVLDGTPNTWFGEITYSDGGGVASMEIGGIKYSGGQLRNLLQLRSTYFTVFPLTDSLIITTRGFGHRVGMSQYGADAMAKNGYSWRQILLHYYQGVEIEEGE